MPGNIFLIVLFCLILIIVVFLWGNCSKTLVNSLEKLLKQSARLIIDEVVDRQNTTPSHVLFSNPRWMSIPERINCANV